MAKTIKEMADKYCEGSSFEDAVMEKPAFISGANAVLKEIDEFIFEEIQMNNIREPHLMLYVVRKKFRELKGEE